MNLMDMITQAGGGSVVQEMARSFGLDERDTRRAIEGLLPALSRGMQRNATQPGGLDALLGALAKGGHDRYVDRPTTLGEADTVADGNAILGHVFGTKDVSRNVAGRAAEQTGLDSGILRRMLPILATVAMGALSKQTQQGRATAAEGESSSLASILGSALDSDRDGSVVDDLLDLARKFF